MIKVTIFNEFQHERENAEIAAIYPQGIHAVIAGALAAEGDMSVRTATLDQPQHGLAEAVLAETDVLLWWGHKAHDQVADAVVERVYERVLQGMGLIVLHSGHYSKIFRRLMGSSCALTWREDG
jgi:trehalose utilization protein